MAFQNIYEFHMRALDKNIQCGIEIERVSRIFNDAPFIWVKPSVLIIIKL